MAIAKKATIGLLLSTIVWIGASVQSLAQSPSSSAMRRAAFCPSVFILPLTESITIFRQNSKKDADTVFFRASLDTATISCLAEENSLPILADISFTGIAETDNAEVITGTLPVFLSLLDRESNVLNKQIEESPIVLTPQVSKVAYNGTFENIRIPLASIEARAGLRFLVGFQLDNKQLQFNREAVGALP